MFLSHHVFERVGVVDMTHLQIVRCHLEPLTPWTNMEVCSMLGLDWEPLSHVKMFACNLVACVFAASIPSSLVWVKADDSF